MNRIAKSWKSVQTTMDIIKETTQSSVIFKPEAWNLHNFTIAMIVIVYNFQLGQGVFQTKVELFK